MTSDLSHKLQLVAETLEWYAAHEAIYPVLNNCVSVKAKEAQAVLARVIEGLEASQHQPVAVGQVLENEKLEQLESRIASWEESIECEENGVEHTTEAADIIRDLYALAHTAYCFRPTTPPTGSYEGIVDTLKLIEKVTWSEYSGDKEQALGKALSKCRSLARAAIEQSSTRHESTSAEVASKAGRVMAEADGLIELLADTYPGIDHDDFQMIRDFFGDAKSVAASALTQREAAGQGRRP